MENASHSSDNEFITCIIVICISTYLPTVATSSTASTLGSHHVFVLYTLFIYDSNFPRYRTFFVFVREDQMTGCNCQEPPY
jgi:hypothetical protein